MAAVARADGPPPAQAPDPAPDGVVNKVTLELQISGLGRAGCEVQVKPGHAGCQFDPVVEKVGRGQVGDRVILRLDPILAKSTHADRECAFAITIKEPGKPPRTSRRGLRLAAGTPDRPIPSQSLTCYLSSPSLAAREGTKGTTRR
jgi:hypothetical protein